MENEIFKNRKTKYSEQDLYKALVKYSQECPRYIKDFLKEMSLPLLASFNPKALLKTTDILLEFLVENKNLSFENVNEILYVTRHKALPILNNKLLDNSILQTETKEMLENEYQSLFENINTLKEEESKREIQEKYDGMLTILDCLGEKFEPVNHIKQLD